MRHVLGPVKLVPGPQEPVTTGLLEFAPRALLFLAPVPSAREFVAVYDVDLVNAHVVFVILPPLVVVCHDRRFSCLLVLLRGSEAFNLVEFRHVPVALFTINELRMSPA
jgi:hypothetical protein